MPYGPVPVLLNQSIDSQLSAHPFFPDAAGPLSMQLRQLENVTCNKFPSAADAPAPRTTLFKFTKTESRRDLALRTSEIPRARVGPMVQAVQTVVCCLQRMATARVLLLRYRWDTDGWKELSEGEMANAFLSCVELQAISSLGTADFVEPAFTTALGPCASPRTPAPAHPLPFLTRLCPS